MKKYEILSQIGREKIVAIIRVKDAEEAERALDALAEGGLGCIELTFTAPYAHSVLERLCKRYEGSEIRLGAGSVLDSETARIAILSGAQFLVTPAVSRTTICTANRYGVPVLTGISTPTEAVFALECGADVVKLFPATAYRPSVIRDVKAPLPNLEVMPTGGIGLDNFADWLRGGAFACGVGGSLLSGLKEGNYAKITRTAQEFVRISKEVGNV